MWDQNELTAIAYWDEQNSYFRRRTEYKHKGSGKKFKNMNEERERGLDMVSCRGGQREDSRKKTSNSCRRGKTYNET